MLPFENRCCEKYCIVSFEDHYCDNMKFWRSKKVIVYCCVCGAMDIFVGEKHQQGPSPGFVSPLFSATLSFGPIACPKSSARSRDRCWCFSPTTDLMNVLEGLCGSMDVLVDEKHQQRPSPGFASPLPFSNH